jgi:hypothetical protein
VRDRGRGSLLRNRRLAGQNGTNLDDTSWAETGEWNQGSGTAYFWAYSTGGDSGFMSYALGPVATADTKGARIAYRGSPGPSITP